MFLGDSLIDSNRLKEADRAFRRASELDSNSALSIAKRAEVQLMLGRLDQAESLGDQAHEMDRDLPHASFVKGICAEFNGQDDVAHFWYRRAQKLNSDQYFAPPRVSRERVEEELSTVVQHLMEESEFADILANTQWTVKETVDGDDAELDDVSPMAYFHLVPHELSPGPRNGTNRENSEGPPVNRAFVFARNILRDCRTEEDIYTQLYVFLLEELENMIPFDEDVESGDCRHRQ